MHESRPVSDSLLARAQHEATHQSRGILKIFLGATAGVGKTYAILEAAPVRRAAGVDVVVGWVDTHGRAETAALLHGLEGSVSKVEMATPMGLLYKALFPSLSTFETPPAIFPMVFA